MRKDGAPRKSRKAILATLVVAAVAIAVLAFALRRQTTHVSTDDASLEAPLVHIGAQVAGRIIELPIGENAHVKRGDLLFRLDPATYADGVRQAEAELALAKAMLESRRRTIATEQANAQVAAQQTKKAEDNLALARRTVDRLQPLAARAFVPVQQLDQAQVVARDSANSLAQAQDLEKAAKGAIGTEDDAVAAVAAREAALAIARHMLDHTEIRAPHDGWVAGLTVTTGEIVAPSQTLFTLIVDEEWEVVANFREFDLPNIRIGVCATAFSMIGRGQPIKGEVESIGWGVLADDTINLPRSLPYVQRSLNWVRVAQRFPVRIRLENPPPSLMRRGASASVEIDHGAACR
ncbi:multidrug transporter subunit MdtN [Rhodoblastus sp.]|uniref:multidrug transporter subunit MdtN n=1 Tax=Rhodoblastus sp. TaxID=1962975 RepID=UPI0035B39A4F